MIRRVLGIDVASANWESIGSAAIEFNDSSGMFTGVFPGVIRWPNADLTPDRLAGAIDAFVRERGICAVALDGPQGWRDPSIGAGEPGVGRRCEYLSRTQGKTGIYPTTYPGNQRPWIEFSIELFARLLSKPGVELADHDDWEPSAVYAVLECFPTSAWRTSGLAPLPGKAKRPLLDPYIRAIRLAYRLPSFSTESHDDLQAVVAALTAVGAVKGPALRMPVGISSRSQPDPRGHRRLEGLIWNVSPLDGSDTGEEQVEALAAVPSARPSNGTVRVSQKVVDQVVRAGVTQMQIAVSKEIGGTRLRKVRISISTQNERFDLIGGDTHVIWRSHQAAETMASFERLFSILSDVPGRSIPAGITISD